MLSDERLMAASPLLSLSDASSCLRECVCVHLVFLLEAVALSTFHLGDVLEEVCDSDRRLELTGLELTCRNRADTVSSVYVGGSFCRWMDLENHYKTNPNRSNKCCQPKCQSFFRRIN